MSSLRLTREKVYEVISPGSLPFVPEIELILTKVVQAELSQVEANQAIDELYHKRPKLETELETFYDQLAQQTPLATLRLILEHEHQQQKETEIPQTSPEPG